MFFDIKNVNTVNRARATPLTISASHIETKVTGGIIKQQNMTMGLTSLRPYRCLLAQTAIPIAASRVIHEHFHLFMRDLILLFRELLLMTYFVFLW